VDQPPVARGAARVFPYAHAPRLPEGTGLAPDDILRASTGDAELEVGPGRGGFILERAQNFPDVRIVGLEIRRKWATLVDERLNNLGLGARARVFAEDARLALPRLLPESYRRVFIHFPDPWWKRRHAKRRLASGGLITEVYRVLGRGGELFIQTDVDESAQAYADAIRSYTDLVPHGDVAGSAELVENPYGARSHRERRALADGLPITRLRFARPT
jgi:tRNA (guanine-N7-)-methyltransferase